MGEASELNFMEQHGGRLSRVTSLNLKNSKHVQDNRYYITT